MKFAALVTLFGLIATAAANPIPDADTAKLEGKYPYTTPSLLETVSWALTDFRWHTIARSCPAGIILESCLRLCSTAKCRSCCNVGCTTC